MKARYIVESFITKVVYRSSHNKSCFQSSIYGQTFIHTISHHIKQYSFPA
ncbi:hypothetical protein Hanom_Chr04g00367811 [Helianthus anomalus]